MAIAVGNSSQRRESPPAFSSTLTVDAGSSSGRLILACVAGTGFASATAGIGSVTYNGASMTKIAEATANSTYTVAVYKTTAEPATGSHNLVVNWNDTWSNQHVNGVALSGVDTTTPNGTAATATGTTTPATVAVSSATGELVIDGVIAIGANETLVATPGAGQTSIQQNHDSLNTMHSLVSSEAGASSITMSWDFTVAASTFWATVGVPIKPASAGTTPITFTGTDSLAGGELL